MIILRRHRREDGSLVLLKTVMLNDYDAAKDTPELASGMNGMSYTYDEMNRKTAVIAPSEKVIQYIAYDANGNAAKKVDGLKYNSSMETSAGTAYIYDGLDRNIQTTDALNGYSHRIRHTWQQ